jgi:hypothetical protein
MTRSQGRHRRRILLAAVALLAGCAGGRSDGDDSDGTITTTTTDTTSPARTDDGGPESTPSTPSSSSTAATGSAGATSRSETTDAVTGTASSPAGGLDLREANVTAVTVSETGDDDDDVRFDVTLHHDDDGEDGYANWWQVETRTGERLGRRDLLHAHGTREFTRSATVTVPSEVACVVVRGHDQTHGYGGRAMLVDPRSGATRAVDQGPAPAQMADELCP